MGDWIVGGRLDRIRLIVNLLSFLIPSGSDKFVRVSMRCSPENTINNAVEFLFRFVGVLECVSAVFQYLGLDLQEIGLNGNSARMRHSRDASLSTSSRSTAVRAS